MKERYGKPYLFFCPQIWKIQNIKIYYQYEDKKNQEAKMTFENQYELKNYLSTRNYPKELRYEMFKAMGKVRKCINGGANNSAVAIAETIEEEQEIITKYNKNILILR